MSKAPLSYDDVALACERLLSKGIEPSLRLVRQEIGRGSLTTIHAFMGTWHEQQRQPVEPTSDAMRALETLAPAAARQLREAYRATIAQEMAVLVRQIDQQRQTLAELDAALHSIEDERDALHQRLTATQIRADAVDRIQDVLGSLLPVLTGQLDAHTAHLSRVIEVHHEAAVTARRVHTVQTQEILRALEHGANTAATLVETIRRIEVNHQAQTTAVAQSLELCSGIAQQLVNLQRDRDAERDHRHRHYDRQMEAMNRRIAHAEGFCKRMIQRSTRLQWMRYDRI